LLVLALGGCGQPQIGADKEAFKTVDALYTAVSLREPKLVDGCEQRLKSLREEGKLPEAASNALVSIIAETRDGKWEPAFDHLSVFMQGQRR
jgi:hypothetical protein